MKKSTLWNDELPVIRYELEVLRPKKWKPRPVILEDFTRMAEILKEAQQGSVWDWGIEEAPLIHPGRVLVSRQVMAHLGRYHVLCYLNLFVRGGWDDGPYAGEFCWRAYYEEEKIRSVHWLTSNISLWIVTNALRTVTVIRFGHERLENRRIAEREVREELKAKREERERLEQWKLEAKRPCFDDDDIPF